MKTINKNTKTGKRFINAYNRSRKSSIYECYCNPSTAKTRAEYLCRDMMGRENGNGYKITGYNCMQFTAGWQTAEGLRIETACNSYLIK